MGRHAKQADILFLAILKAGFKGVFLLVEAQRTVTTQLDADRSVVAVGFHVCRHLLPGIQGAIGSNSDNGQVRLQLLNLGVLHLGEHIPHVWHPRHSHTESPKLCKHIGRRDEECC